MKFSTAAFLVTTLRTSVVFATPSLDGEASSKTPIGIKVQCDGIDFTKLSLSDNTMAGRILEDSYNSVHASYDNDDSVLDGLTFRGGGILGDYSEEEEESLEWWKPRKPPKTAGEWVGTYACDVCPRDDDAFLAFSGDTSVLKAWENSFVAGLLESTRKAFQNVKSCVIDMSPSTKDNNFDFRPNVDIKLFCGKNTDLSNLSASKVTFLAHSVESSYNKVHGNAADDDSALEHVTYHAPPVKQSSMVGMTAPKPAPVKPPPKPTSQKPPPGYRYTPGLDGWWGCRLCPKDDDAALLGLAAAASGAMLSAWEAELLVAFQEGPFDFFRNIEKCNILLLPHAMTEEADDASDGSSTPCAIRGGCEAGVTVEE